MEDLLGKLKGTEDLGALGGIQSTIPMASTKSIRDKKDGVQ